MHRHQRTVEVSWTRTRTSANDTPRETIRLRDARGNWQEVEALDQLPADIRQMIDGLMSRELPADDSLLDELPLDELPKDVNSVEHSRRVVKQRTIKPRRRRSRHVRKTESDDTLRLEYVWFEGCAVLLGLFGIPLLAYWAYEASSKLPGGVPGAMLRGVLWLVPLAVAYYVLATILNRTVITVADGRLTVQHGPIPWLGNRDLDINDIHQLYCTVYRGGKYYQLRWRLQAATGLVGSITLLDHIRSKSEAVSLELAIERHLGIPDWPRWGD